jgi:plasmid stability protein
VAQLIVRNIEDAVVRQLRVRAASHGVSMEEEHRRVLRTALLGEVKNRKSFSEMLLSIPKATADESGDLFDRQRDLPREIEL